MTTEDAKRIAARFAITQAVTGAVPLTGGHINDSFRLTVAGGRAFLLQRLNPDVFPQSSRVMENVVNVTRYLERRVTQGRAQPALRRVPSLVPARDGRAWTNDDDGACWRLFTELAGSVRERADSPAEARAAATAFGAFLRLMGDYDGPPLRETIRAFHDTERRFAALEAAVHADPLGRAIEARREIEALLLQRDAARVLPPLLARGDVPVRIVHNDAKIANVLFDTATGEPLGVADFDTVMPGLALYDFGDLVRSAASPCDEDERDLGRIEARAEFVEALASGYLEAAGDILTPRERTLLVFAGRLITLEQSVRFLTDYLEGDHYYRIRRPGHNLDRARAQLRLFESLTEREAEIEARVMVLCG